MAGKKHMSKYITIVIFLQSLTLIVLSIKYIQLNKEKDKLERIIFMIIKDSIKRYDIQFTEKKDENGD